MHAMMIVPSNFPEGDAGAVRDMAFAKIYQELGYQVTIIGMGKQKQRGIIEGIEYYSLYKEKETKLEHFIQKEIAKMH